MKHPKKLNNKFSFFAFLFGLILLLQINFPLTAQTESSDPEDQKYLKKKEVITSRLAKRWTIIFTNERGKDVPLQVEVAISEQEKSRGLMLREHLGKNNGMIFVYQKPDFLSFWMRHTKLPLSIAFVDEKNRIMEIYHMNPFDETIIRSDIKAKYAIEVNRGWFRRNMIFHGNKMRIIQNEAKENKRKENDR